MLSNINVTKMNTNHYHYPGSINTMITIQHTDVHTPLMADSWSCYSEHVTVEFPLNLNNHVPMIPCNTHQGSWPGSAIFFCTARSGLHPGEHETRLHGTTCCSMDAPPRHHYWLPHPKSGNQAVGQVWDSGRHQQVWAS